MPQERIQEIRSRLELIELEKKQLYAELQILEKQLTKIPSTLKINFGVMF